ncbi:hypothetical protein SCARD494_07485 [Seiridium cardinale]
MPVSKLLSITLILSCALLGGYASIFLSFHHGFFDALRICTSSVSTSKRECTLNMPHVAHIPSYTKIPSIDSRLAILFEFFAQGLMSQGSDNGLDVQAILAMSYLAAQFGGAWYLLVLEGLRKGNAGTVLSHTGKFGIVFQVATITVVGPIFLVIHLLSYQNHYQNNITVELLDLELLPISFGLAYIVPTIGLVLPLLNYLTPTGDYLAISLWQPFPLYQSALQYIFRHIAGRRKMRNKRPDRGEARLYEETLGRTYRFILSITIGSHIIVLGAIAMSHLTSIFPKISAMDLLSPDSLASPATLALLNPPVSATAARSIVISFLRWDVYCCCAALIIWATYLLYSTQKSGTPLGVITRVLFWTFIGGPVTPAIMLLWQRDIEVMDAVDYCGFTKRE